MKVLHVVEKMDPKMGGVSQAVRTMIHGLDESGVQNEVVSLDDPNSAFLSHDLIVHHPLGSGTGFWRYSSILLPWLEANLIRFDVLIIHGLWLYHSYAVHKAVKKLRKFFPNDPDGTLQVFVMPHGMLAPYLHRANGRKLKAIRKSLYWKLIESRVVNAADGLLFTCEEERRLAHKPFSSYNPKNEIVVGMGVEEGASYVAGEDAQTVFKNIPTIGE